MSLAPAFGCGTRTGYDEHGCRCAACRKTHAARIARQRESRKPLSRRDPRHGSLGAYVNFRCRCARCLAACFVATSDYSGLSSVRLMRFDTSWKNDPF
jgi:hypothetical protein